MKLPRQRLKKWSLVDENRKEGIKRRVELTVQSFVPSIEVHEISWLTLQEI